MKTTTRTFTILAILFGICAPSLRAGLVAHWTFDESSGTTAHDSTGNYDGTLFGGATFVSGGVSGNALSLNESTNSYVDVGTSFPGFTSGDFSLSIWVKTTQTSQQWAISKHDAQGQPEGGPNGYALFLNQSGGVYGNQGGATFYNSAYSGHETNSTTLNLNNGQWHMITGVFNSANNTDQIYIDGTLENTNSGRSPVANNSPLIIGGVGETNGNNTPFGLFTGLIDDAQVYNNALTSTEVEYLYQHPGMAIIPEPQTWALALLGLSLLFIRRVRHSRATFIPQRLRR